MKKRKFICNLIFFLVFVSILFFPNSVDAITTTSTTNGTSTSISEVFSLVDENGGNLSTNSHYEFLSFWYDDDGDFNILWFADKQAAGKKAVSLDIGGISIDEIIEYTGSLVVTLPDGSEVNYTASNGGKYYRAKFSGLVDFSQPFSLSLNVGSGGFNVIAQAKVQFYILVKNNVDGVLTVDWEQSRGNVTEGAVYKINANAISNKNYMYYDLTLPNETTSTRSRENFVNVTGASGITNVTFYYTQEIITRNINVQKIWKDQENLENSRPEKIRIVLIADGAETDKYYDLNIANNESQYTFTGVDKYNLDNSEIVYTVSEKEVNTGDLSRYKPAEIIGNMVDGFEITNTLKRDYVKSIEISKQSSELIYSLNQSIYYGIDFYFEIDPEFTDIAEIEIIDTLPLEINTSNEYDLDGGIYASGDKTITWTGTYDSQSKQVTWSDGSSENLNDTNHITKEIYLSYDDLFEFDKQEIENIVTGTLNLESNDEIQSVEDKFKHTVDFDISIVINKFWEGDIDTDESGNEIVSSSRPSQITVALYDENKRLLQEIILNNENNWNAQIDKLPKYDESQNEIQYVVMENDLPMGYASFIDKNIEENVITFNITNKTAVVFPETGREGVIIYSLLRM